MLKVQFNDVDEFFEELLSIAPPRVARVTTVYRASPQVPDALFHVSVIAAVLNDAGQLVELLVYCGSLLHRNADDHPLITRANELVSRLSSRAQQMGFDVRSGRFLVAEAA